MGRQGQAGLRNYRNRAIRALVFGGIVLAVGLTVRAGGALTRLPVTFGITGLGLGLGGIIRTVRVARLIDRHGWRERSALFRVAPVGGNGQPALLLRACEKEPEVVLSVATTAFRWGALNGHDQLWVTGDPLSRFAAVATPDWQHIVVVKRPATARWTRRLRRILDDSSSEIDGNT